MAITSEDLKTWASQLKTVSDALAKIAADIGAAVVDPPPPDPDPVPDPDPTPTPRIPRVTITAPNGQPLSGLIYVGDMVHAKVDEAPEIDSFNWVNEGVVRTNHTADYKINDKDRGERVWVEALAAGTKIVESSSIRVEAGNRPAPPPPDPTAVTGAELVDATGQPVGVVRVGDTISVKPHVT